jgi:uncharacterized protein YbjT (DUF2867 family)
MAGVNRLVIVNPLSPEMAEQAKTLVAAARRAGVMQVLRFSVMGAGEPDPIEEARWHDAADEAVRQLISSANKGRDNRGLRFMVLFWHRYSHAEHGPV